MPDLHSPRLLALLLISLRLLFQALLEFLKLVLRDDLLLVEDLRSAKSLATRQLS